jgi:hypothetical protein
MHLRGGRVWWLVPVALFVISMALTEPPFAGDSIIYVNQIAAVRDGTAPQATLWEFGHILWRPVAYALSGLFVSFIPNAIAWTPWLKIMSGMILMNLLGGLLATVLIYAFSLRFSGSVVAAIVASVLWVWGDAVLAYSQTGAPYIVAVAILLAGLWWQAGERPGNVAGPAFLFGLTALFWFPFAVAIPAASCAARFLAFPGSTRRKMSWPECLLSAVISGAVVLAGVGAAAWLAGVRSEPELVAWAVSAGHGMQQNRRWIRAVSGFPRLLIDPGPDGVYLKRFVLHDPYYPVSAIGVLRHSLWKVGVFYAFAASLALLVWQSAARRSSVLLAIAAAAGIFAAVVVFEPSSPERLLPVLPFFLIALSAAWNSQWRWAAALRVAIGGFAALLVILNLPAFEWGHSAEHRQAEIQLEEFRQHAKPQDLMLVATMFEPTVRLMLNPFEPINRDGAIHCAWILDPIRKDAADWRRKAADEILANWQSGNDVWVTTAALAERPDASSQWVEGDNPAVHWREVPAFFNGLEFDPGTSVSGFERLLPSPGNRERLAPSSSLSRPDR